MKRRPIPDEPRAAPEYFNLRSVEVMSPANPVRTALAEPNPFARQWSTDDTDPTQLQRHHLKPEEREMLPCFMLLGDGSWQRVEAAAYYLKRPSHWRSDGHGGKHFVVCFVFDHTTWRGRYPKQAAWKPAAVVDVIEDDALVVDGDDQC
jgi:hypothetical protein